MKTQLTHLAYALIALISIGVLFSSCSISNQFALEHPHYHLNLVKANTHPQPSDKKTIEKPAEVAPLAQNGSMVSYKSDGELKQLTGLLKTNMKILKKETKKSDPVTYHQLKTININKTVNQLINQTSNHGKLSVTEGGGGYAGRNFALFIIFLLLALLFYILAFGASIFWIFGFLCSIAAAIFFILWIISLAS